MFVDHYVVQADSWVGSVFQTTVGSTVVFKDELPAATESLIKRELQIGQDH